jgi:hypothetical protein
MTMERLEVKCKPLPKRLWARVGFSHGNREGAEHLLLGFQRAKSLLNVFVDFFKVFHEGSPVKWFGMQIGCLRFHSIGMGWPLALLSCCHEIA